MPTSHATPSSRTRVETVKVVSNEHLNANNTLFGGYLMCWVDEIAYMCACRFTRSRACVTVGIDEVSFQVSQRLGEHVHLVAQIVHTGRSSMTIEVEVFSENLDLKQRVVTNRAILTFVCLSSDGKPLPAPQLALDGDEAKTKYLKAAIRQKLKKRMNRFIDQRVNRLVGASLGPQSLEWSAQLESSKQKGNESHTGSRSQATNAFLRVIYPQTMALHDEIKNFYKTKTLPITRLLHQIF